MSQSRQNFHKFPELDIADTVKNCILDRTWRPNAVALLALDGSIMFRREKAGILTMPTEEILRSNSRPELLFTNGRRYSGLVAAAAYAGLACYDMHENAAPTSNTFEMGVVAFLVEGQLKKTPQAGSNESFEFVLLPEDQVLEQLGANFDRYHARRTGLAIAAVHGYIANV